MNEEYKLLFQILLIKLPISNEKTSLQYTVVFIQFLYLIFSKLEDQILEQILANPKLHVCLEQWNHNRKGKQTCIKLYKVEPISNSKEQESR